MRMYAVHSEYEVVVFKESSAQRTAAVAKGGLGVLPHKILKKNTCLCGIWSYLSGSTAVLNIRE